MLLSLFIWGILGFFSTLTVARNELQVVVMDIDFVFNPKYFAPGGEAFLLDNGIDNEVFVNFTVIKTIPETTVVRFRMLGATRGEYIVPIGLDQVMTLCVGLEDPVLGRQFAEKMGVTECPILPGNYGSSSMILYNSKKLPDSFIRNKFLSLTELITPENEEIWRISIYSRIDYIEVNE